VDVDLSETIMEINDLHEFVPPALALAKLGSYFQRTFPCGIHKERTTLGWECNNKYGNSYGRVGCAWLAGKFVFQNSRFAVVKDPPVRGAVPLSDV